LAQGQELTGRKKGSKKEKHPYKKRKKRKKNILDS
jgi:hypothetical protein